MDRKSIWTPNKKTYWPLCLCLALAGCSGEEDSSNAAKPPFEENDYSAMVGTWHDPKRDRRLTVFEQGDFFENGLSEIQEITQVQKNYFRVRPKKSNRYVLFYVHNDKVLLVIGSHFDRDLNMDLSRNRKLTKSQIYKHHNDLVQAASEIEKGNLDIENVVNGFPLFEEIAIRISAQPEQDYEKAKQDARKRGSSSGSTAKEMDEKE